MSVVGRSLRLKTLLRDGAIVCKKTVGSSSGTVRLLGNFRLHSRAGKEEQSRVSSDKVYSDKKLSKIYPKTKLNKKTKSSRALEVSSSVEASSGDINGSSCGSDQSRKHVDSGAHSVVQDGVFSPGMSPAPVVYCDGCCIHNGNKDEAKAGVGVFWESGSPHNVSVELKGKQSNNRAELEAACRAIQSAIFQGYSSVEIRTDSSFVIMVAKTWSKKWQRNGWRTSGGYRVKNKAVVSKLLQLSKKVNVKWTHVYGHTGVPGNEEADALAKAGAQRVKS